MAAFVILTVHATGVLCNVCKKSVVINSVPQWFEDFQACLGNSTVSFSIISMLSVFFFFSWLAHHSMLATCL